jgi:hypothetical protein
MVEKKETDLRGIRKTRITLRHCSPCPNLAERNFYGGLLEGGYPRSPKLERESTNPSVEVFQSARSMNV